MIRNSFCILDGIGEKKEQRLWREGILTWRDFTAADEVLGFGRERKELMDEVLHHDNEELSKGNAGYFAHRIRRREQWRLFDYFRGETLCLDIETNGLQPYQGGYVTMVGLYDGYDYRCMVRGENLSAEGLSEALRGYKYLITFYGAVFDVPFLMRSLPGVRFDMPHFDLCFAAKRLGIKGGLKKLEEGLGIMREESVRGLDGYAAVKLWEMVLRGSDSALETLVQYNREDTVNLMHIATLFYQRLRHSTGIEEYLPCGVA